MIARTGECHRCDVAARDDGPVDLMGDPAINGVHDSRGPRRRAARRRRPRSNRRRLRLDRPWLPNSPGRSLRDVCCHPRRSGHRGTCGAGIKMVLNEMAGDGGMSATVMTSDGTWSGTAGTADGVRAVQVDDQFSIASITKSIVEAQVMQWSKPATCRSTIPPPTTCRPDVDVDTNGATIRQLLNHPQWAHQTGDEVHPVSTLGTGSATCVDARRAARDRGATQAGPLGLISSTRSINYFLLGLIIEQVRGHPLAQGAARRRPRHRRSGAARLSTR